MRSVIQDGLHAKSCPHCAYDTRGNSGWTCPECGKDIRKPSHASIRRFAVGMLSVAGFATLLCFLLRKSPGSAYLALALAYLIVCLNSLALPALIVLNAVRRRQDGCDSLHQRVLDGLFVLAAWVELGLSYLALRSSGAFATFEAC